MRDGERDTFQNKQISPGFALSLTLGQGWQCATPQGWSEEGASNTAGVTSPKGTPSLRKSCLGKPAGVFKEWEGPGATLAIPPSQGAPSAKSQTPMARASSCSSSSLFHEKLLTEDTQWYFLHIRATRFPSKIVKVLKLVADNRKTHNTIFQIQRHNKSQVGGSESKAGGSYTLMKSCFPKQSCAWWVYFIKYRELLSLHGVR